MPLTFRLARPEDLPALEAMILESFEPITWFKKLDDSFGPLNGQDWRTRWKARIEKVFATQILLLGELGGEMVAAATGTYEEPARLGYIDLLAVQQRHQGKGYGREMLRGMTDHFRSLGGAYVHLECLADNDVGNALYRSEGYREVARSLRWFKPLD